MLLLIFTEQLNQCWNIGYLIVRFQLLNVVHLFCIFNSGEKVHEW